MPRLSTIIDDLSERFSFEATKLNSLARSLREAGLITQGARGVNAPAATSLDAARLLIAMMLNSKMATVVEDVRLVGGFTVLDPTQLTAGFSPETLEQGLAKVIDYAGTAPDNTLDDLTAYFELTPYAALGEIGIARIPEEGEAKQTRVIFTHPEVDAERFPELPASYHDAAKRFPVGFMQKPIVERHNLFAIGKLVMGADQ